MTRSLLSSLALSALAMAFASSASAATTNSSFTTQASVSSSCQITQVQDMSFGAYDPLAATGKELNTEFVLRCSAGTTAIYKVSEGLYASTGSTCQNPVRNMRSEGGAVLNYAINFSNGRPVVCSDSANQTFRFDTTSFERRLPLRGQLATGQDAQVGSYSDTVTISVTF